MVRTKKKRRAPFKYCPYCGFESPARKKVCGFREMPFRLITDYN